MRILFNTPFKPLDHHTLSGDVTIARDLFDYLNGRGHELRLCPNVNATWLYWKPWLWRSVALAREDAFNLANAFKADAVLTYHSYYKAPDLVGPHLRSLGLPYFIFSGAYAEKRRAYWKTRPGYELNKRALLAADHLFSNKDSDDECLERILPKDRHTFVRQGIRVADFGRDDQARARLRDEWGVGSDAGCRHVVTTAAVLRPGVKVEGVGWVIHCCAELRKRGLNPLLVVAGDGPGRDGLEALAREVLPGGVRFLGLVERARLSEVFSASDLFAFPGVNEGLGMVYLEAQACGLPVVATDHAGAKDVVRHGETGLLAPSFDMDAYVDNVEKLLRNSVLRSTFSGNAARFVRRVHDIDNNYGMMERVMLDILADEGKDEE